MPRYTPPDQSRVLQFVDIIFLLVAIFVTLWLPLKLGLAGAAKEIDKIENPTWESLRQTPAQVEQWEKLGYDVESRVPGTGRLRFLEVKGRVTGAATITVTKNEILTSLNKPDDFILALVEFLDGDQHRVHYLRRPFQREPDPAGDSVNHSELLPPAEVPR